MGSSDPAAGVALTEPPVGGHLLVSVLGERVALGPWRREMIETYARWYNDPPGLYLTGAWRPATMEGQASWYEHAATSESNISFTIYETGAWQPIGTAELSPVDPYDRAAEFGIFIGEPEYRGKGYGTEATRLTLDYAFSIAGLHSVMLWVMEYNAAAIRAYEKAGFQESGRRRQSHYASGRWWDKVMMDVLADEFESPVLRRALGQPGRTR